MHALAAIFAYGQAALLQALHALVLPAIVFALLALVVRGRQALAAARQAGEELRINLWFYFLDALFVMPVMAFVVAAIGLVLEHANLVLLGTSFWAALHPLVVLFLVVFLGDFIGYWRHRLEHTRLLWPGHAIHHSDTEMTWLTLARFHPVNRVVTTVVDSTFLLALGLPAWAIVANNVVRHYYGYFIHADLPWTYGPLSTIFVSPAMHRWHHARDLRYAGTNFATVFAVFDRTFGTFALPGPCNVPLGVEEDMGCGFRGQLFHPLRVWCNQLMQALRRPNTAGRQRRRYG